MVRASNTLHEGKTTCGNNLGSLPSSLDYGSHARLASPSTNTTTSRGFDKPRSCPIPSIDNWMTCSPHLLALTSSGMSPQEGSWYCNSQHMTEPAIHSTISCITGSSWPLTLRMTCCYARSFQPTSTARLFHGSTASQWTPWTIFGIYRRPSWDTTYVLHDIIKTSVPCKT